MRIFDVIQYNGNDIVYKHRNESFNSGSRLQVGINQKAVFIRNGIFSNTFGPGIYDLTVDNLPILRKFVEATTGGKSPFCAQLYFFNTSNIMNIPWGSSSRFYLSERVNTGISPDGVCKIPVSIGVHCLYDVKIQNPRRLLEMHLGNIARLDENNLQELFKGILETILLTELPKLIQVMGISVFDLEQHLQELSKNITSILRPHFSDSGIDLLRINILGFERESDSGFQELKRLYNLETSTISEERIRAAARKIGGYSWTQEQYFRIMENYSKNNRSSSFADFAIQLEMARQFGGQMGNMFDTKKICPVCKVENEKDAKFCKMCGSVL